MSSEEEQDVQNAEGPPLRICFITTFPPRFDGIAVYSHELIKALTQRGHTIYVICNLDRNVGGHADQENVFPVMDPEKDGWSRDVFNVVAKLKPDAVHIQHEYGIYDIDGKLNTGLLDLLVELNLARLPTVITYHSVYRTLGDKERLFMNISIQLVDAGIVHEELQKIFLPVNLGWVPQNVKVIAHGAEVLEAGGVPDVREAKRKYGLEGKDVVMCLGWWEPYKRFEDVIQIWPQVVAQAPNAVLVVAGDARPGSRSGVHYKSTLLKVVEESPARESIVVIQGSFIANDYLIVENAADVIVLPYDQSTQSGVLAHAFSLGKPVIVTDVGGLRAEVHESGAGVVVSRGDLNQLKEYIALLLSDQDVRQKYARRALEYVEKRIGWDYVAGLHQLLYRSITKERGHQIRT